MKRLFLLLALLATPLPAAAQTAQCGAVAGKTCLNVQNPDGSQITGGTVQGGGVYNTTPPTLTNGQTAQTQMDVNGNTKVTVVNTNPNGAAAASGASPVTPSNVAVGSAAMATGQISCATTSTALAAARTGVAGTGRIAITITNLGTNAVNIGNTGVTTATGFTIPGVIGAALTLNTQAAIFCVAGTTQTVAFVETF